ncbi:MAG: four helix bundle protein [Candidatus Berkelbacteria bacterium]|nr:four helix bundle protein [Candidatus Berkelbacteria bacterium]
MVKDIDNRTFEFGLRIIELVNLLPRNISGNAIANQLMRSGTSIGANVEEAFGGHTKTEFIYKMNVAKSEARETKYWLKLIDASSLIKSPLINFLNKEIDELVAILTTIVRKSKIK